MTIEFHRESQTFHLHNAFVSYIFKVLPSGHLGQLYYGRAIHDRPDFDHLFETAYRSMSVCYFDGEPAYSLEHIKQEYPTCGAGDIHLPALTEKDISDIQFAVENDFDFIAASFIRRADDVRSIREVLHRFGGDNIQIISKIENQEGVDNIDEILEVSDGIMVARGDLGVEIPAAKVPVLQKQIIRKGLRSGKPIITATQMLDSMIRNPRPTRAEVSDVANAVFDGTSCVMLSGETAGGKYPLEALAAMVGIVEEAEQSINYWRQFQKHRITPEPNINDAITHTCCLTAMDLNATAILAATNSGRTARMICRFRPACPIAALTMQEKVRRQMAICWGVYPFLTGEVNSTDRIFSLSVECALKEGLVKNGDTVVITAGVPLGRSGSTNLIKAQIVDEEML